MVNPGIALDADAVHVWRMAIDNDPASSRRYWDLLTDAERARAGQFVREQDSRGFIVVHGALRALLSRYTGEAPPAIAITTSAYGKPLLDDASGLHFNLSHSSETAVFAIARRPVGIDVERIRPLADVLDIARRFFSPTECAAILAAPDDVRMRVFFSCWTRKEAYIKARGEGLSLPLASFSVSLAPDAPGLLNSDQGPTEVRRWSFANVTVTTDHVGAVAVEGSFDRLHESIWNDRGAFDSFRP